MYWACKVRPSVLVHVRTGSPAKTSRGKKQSIKMSLILKIAHVFHYVYDPSRDHCLANYPETEGWIDPSACGRTWTGTSRPVQRCPQSVFHP